MSLSRLTCVRKGIMAIFFMATFLLVGIVSYLTTQDIAVAVGRAVFTGSIAGYIGNFFGRRVDQIYRAAHQEYCMDEAKERTKKQVETGRQQNLGERAKNVQPKSAPQASGGKEFEPLVATQNEGGVATSLKSA